MPLKQDPLHRIYQYAAEARVLQQAQIGESDSSNANKVVGADERLQKTLELMRERVQQQRADLEKLRSSLPSTITLPRQPSNDLRERLLQLRNIRNAYEILTPASPNAVTLLPPDSLFPALLALRTVAQTVNNTRTAVQRTRKEIVYAEDELSRERASLQDAREFSTSLKARIGQVNNVPGSRSSTDSSANERKEERIRTYLFAVLKAQEKRVGTIRQGTEHLKRALSLFLRERLAPTLLEEELRSPDDGPESSVGSGEMANDYNDNGYEEEEEEELIQAPLSRKRKKQGVSWRQMSMLQSWNDVQHKEDNSLPNVPAEPLIAEGRASQEMEQLIKDLVNALRNRDMDPYITLERVSLQARYLVSAKIAQPHPKDATCLRLVDF